MHALFFDNTPTPLLHRLLYARRRFREKHGFDADQVELHPRWQQQASAINIAFGLQVLFTTAVLPEEICLSGTPPEIESADSDYT
jgi:hypothetical protein